MKTPHHFSDGRIAKLMKQGEINDVDGDQAAQIKALIDLYEAQAEESNETANKIRRAFVLSLHKSLDLFPKRIEIG
jgi:uncharacterized protein YyaL (SSP411 family)